MPRKRTTQPPPATDPAATVAATTTDAAADQGPQRHRDVESFLRAIALGTEPATMAQRLRAAATLLRASPGHASDVPPRQRARLAAAEAERIGREEWRARSDAIRQRLKEAKT